MPELPEIETVRRVVGPQIAGRTVTGVTVNNPGVIAHPNPEGFAEGLTGRRFERMDRRGKFLTAVLDDGSRLVMHMRMTGCLLVAPPDRTPEPHTHVIIALDDGMEIRFSDTRRFGRLWLFGRDEVDTSGTSRLGLEPDDLRLCADYLESRVGNSRRAVKECLLDQGLVAGIGNIYSDEILFNVGIDPARPACELCHEDWERLAEVIPRTIGFFVEKNAISDKDYLESAGRDYRNTPYIRIYGHAGEPCPVCGTKLVKRTVGGRGSVYCPNCQRRRWKNPKIEDMKKGVSGPAQI